MADRTSDKPSAELIAALTAVASARARLERTGLPWSREHDAAAAAAVMLGTTAVSVARELLTVGLVGGASSGKSTLLNNLVGRVISDVAIRAHTTEGPIVAACPDQIDVIRTHVRERGWLLR